MQDDVAEDGFDRAFGERVREARKVLQWSQRRLAEELEGHGVKLDPSAVTRIEQGLREPKLREAAAIAEALGVSLQQLTPPPNKTVAEQFEYYLQLAGERGGAARIELGAMVAYYTMALHLLESPEHLAELGVKVNTDGVDRTDTRRKKVLETLVELLKNEQRPAIVHLPDSDQVELLRSAVGIIASSVVALESNAEAGGHTVDSDT